MYIIWLRFKLWIQSFRKEKNSHELYIYEEDEDK